MSEYQQYLIIYRALRREPATMWAACPEILCDLGLEPVWCKAWASYYADRFQDDPLTLTLHERLTRRKYPIAYAA